MLRNAMTSLLMSSIMANGLPSGSLSNARSFDDLSGLFTTNGVEIALVIGHVLDFEVV